MAMLGLQADMRHKSHLLGCYTAWDLNLDVNGTVWSSGNADRILKNRHYSNGTLPSSSDLNIFHSKNLLKQTMLNHEAEFRDQIHELHRLYRRQKELMDEMKKIGLYNHHLSLGTLQHVLPPKSYNHVQLPQHTSNSIKLVHSQSPVSEAKDSISHLHSYNGNRGQEGHDPIYIESSSNAPEFTESNRKNFGKKILDLELPADEYIDSEEEGFSEVKMAPEVSEVKDRGDKELSISGSGCNSVLSEGNFFPCSISLKPKVLADLNIPVKVEEDIIPELGDSQDPIIGYRETSLWDLSGKSNSNFEVLSKGVIPNNQIMRDPEADLGILLLDKHNMQRECISCNDKAGQNKSDLNSSSHDLSTEKLSVEHIDDEQAQDSSRPHGLGETQAKLCNEILQNVGGDISSSSCKPVATSDIYSSYQIVPLIDTMNDESSSLLSWRRNFKRSPIAVQALPCFKGKSSKSFTGSPGLARNELCLSKKLLTSPELYSAATFQQANRQNDFQLEGQPPSTSSDPLNCNNDNGSAFERQNTAKYTKDFAYVMSVKSLDLNSVLPSFSSNTACAKDASHIHGEKTLENSTACSSQITGMPVDDRKSGERRDQAVSLDPVLEKANSVCVHDAELDKVGASNSLDCTRILGFDMQNKPHIPNGQCSSHVSPARNHLNPCAKEDIKDKEKVKLPDINLEVDLVPVREKQPASSDLFAQSKPCEKDPGFGVLIDLNSCVSLNASPLMTSHPIEIDLDPPASPENNERSPPRGESDENQLETSLVSSGQEDGDLQEALVRIAAEAMVFISSSEIQTCLESIGCEPSKASCYNSLYWFARVASSVVDDPGSEYGVNIGVKGHGDHEEYLSDGIDYFEAMTLNLKELTVEESWCKSNGQKDEELSAIFLRNQPKRGRTRRGRQQRKDFQSEVLPSLASLSRYEATEDLQMIGGLMEAGGAQMENGSSKNAGRNGYAKGRRRSNARASNVMESTMNTMLKQQSVNEVGIQQRRLIEWGKITRRPRRPRCPSSNPRLILGQV